MTAGLPPRMAYERWAPTYATSGRNPLAAAAEAALEAVRPLVVGQRVLDVGCGDGRWVSRTLAGGADGVVGLDLTEGMLRAARRRVPRGRFVAGDMRALPFGAGTFDVVVCALALAHVPEPDPPIREAARVLVASGWLALVDLHPDAASRGWRRTFRTADGRLHEVAWTPHGVARVQAACESAGLEVAAVEIRSLDPTDLLPDAPPSAAEGPAVYALAARRRGGTR